MIGKALWAVAVYVDDNATNASWDQHQRFTNAQRLAKSDKIRAVATEIRVLAEAAEARMVRYGEFEVLKDRLYGYGLPLPPNLLQSVAAAFHSAGGPVKVRARGWLKPS